MLDVVESALNSARMVPCPGCGARALSIPVGEGSPCVVSCAGCDRRWDALADVEIVGDTSRLRGNCCSGYRLHELRWRQDPGAPERMTPFQTWSQDHLLLRSGDRASLLFTSGDLTGGPVRRRAHRPLPLIVANHTLPGVWALAGSVPVATLR